MIIKIPLGKPKCWFCRKHAIMSVYDIFLCEKHANMLEKIARPKYKFLFKIKQ